VVVFSQWKRMLRLAEWAVSDLLGDAGLKAVYFTGDESQRRRTENVVEFHEDPRTRVFFATDAGGVGLNLQHAASACVHLDLPWNPAVLEQRSGRIYRLGQKSPVEIYALVSASGIESRIASIVGDKKALFDGLFDGASDEVRFEKGGSFMQTLQRVLAPEPAPGDEASGTTGGAPSSGPDGALEPSPIDLAAAAGPPEDGEEDAQGPSGDVVDAAEPAGQAVSVAPQAQSAATAEPSPESREGPAREATTADADSAPRPLSSAASELVAGIRVERLPDGRLLLEANPEVAQTFAAMLEGVAGLLRKLGETGR
jgi:hypothetical protein